MCNYQINSNRIAALVSAAQRGDRDAFGQLYDQYVARVRAIVARRVRDSGDAQELCQDVFIQAMQKLHQLREPAAFGGWIAAIAQRMAVNFVVRRRRDRLTGPDYFVDVVDSIGTPVAHVLAGERRAQVRRALRQLKQMDRATLEAFYVRGQSLAQMSDEFDAPLGTIKRRLHVARRRLAEQLEPGVAAC